MSMFHRVVSVVPLDEMRLLVRFADDTVKRYDARLLPERHPAFGSITLPGLFNQVRVDTGGYGIVWGDDLDLSSEELWSRGEPA